MSMNETADRRRHGVIETRYRQHGKIAMYDLTINGKLWACVEWSPSRRGWCIQDASGRCLAHCDAIHGQDVDAADGGQAGQGNDPRRPYADARKMPGNNLRNGCDATGWANLGSLCKTAPKPSTSRSIAKNVRDRTPSFALPANGCE